MALLMGAELLEMADGQSLDLRIPKWEIGELDIHPAYGERVKRIRALRVWVPPEDKRLGPPYWDITSQTLIAQLEPYLGVETFRTRVFRVTKYGIAPRARFTLEVR
mgnify:CR=1 FL=1